MVKRGMIPAQFFSFALVLIALILLAVFFNLVDTGLNPIFSYDVEDVTRFQSCDITLINLLRTPVPNQDYDFSGAIAMNEDITSSGEILDKVFEQEVELQYGNCLGFDNCCSQIVPIFDDGSGELKEEVRLVAL